MSAEGQKLAGFLVATVALGLVVAVCGQRVLGVAAGPESELITQLKRFEQPGQVFDPRAQLVGDRVSYQRLSVSLDASGQRAVVTGTLDFTGTLGGGVKVGSLGLERVRFERRDDGWRFVDGPAPRLAAIVRALERRRVALSAGAIPEAPGLDVERATLFRRLSRREFTVEAWYIRSEREGAEVAEDSRLVGVLPERPVDERSTRRLTLVEDARGEFSFPHGLL
ncbi:MAG: hypothetical protein INH41_13830 [Myxococcaceae bacterium]|nr:hypothetical protein [Myxococcaceae bacterium]MCA3013458.1 hypothetical protein [Myxococcaceae bacterium]